MKKLVTLIMMVTCILMIVTGFSAAAENDVRISYYILSGKIWYALANGEKCVNDYAIGFDGDGSSFIELTGLGPDTNFRTVFAAEIIRELPGAKDMEGKRWTVEALKAGNQKSVRLYFPFSEDLPAWGIGKKAWPAIVAKQFSGSSLFDIFSRIAGKNIEKFYQYGPGDREAGINLQKSNNRE